MTDRPIIFSAPMIRAILSGVKTQTRRVLKPQPKMLRGAGPFYRPHPVTAPREWHALHGGYIAAIVQVRYAVGDRLWVREAHLRRHSYIVGEDGGPVWFLADGEPDRGNWERRKHPSIHMPRWASRLTLTVTDVRVQRLQEISEDDARAEGAEPVLVPPDGGSAPHVEGFRCLWSSIHGPAAWDANPWVVALTFTVERRNIDAGAA